MYKSLRLRALSTNPEAFGSNHAYESAFDDDTWRSRLLTFAGRPGVVMVDEINDDIVGLVGVGETERPEIAIVWGMWVDPSHRRQGVARRLLVAAIEWARNRQHRAAELGVYDGNDPAHLLYVSVGFVEIGRRDNGELILRLDL